MKAEINMNEYMKDSMGRLVPMDVVPEIDKTRDSLVKELIGKAKALQADMKRFKELVMGDVHAFVELSAEKYDVSLGGKKGNVSLTSFDGQLKIQMAISETMSFDERLKAAKALIDQCIADWTEGSRSELKVLVLGAFQVDKEGQINTGRILGLRRLQIEDPRWIKAMKALSESLQVIGSKSYIRLYERTGEDNKWTAIPLDMAAL
jgi:hypothetical protein